MPKEICKLSKVFVNDMLGNFSYIDYQRLNEAGNLEIPVCMTISGERQNLLFEFVNGADTLIVKQE